MIISEIYNDVNYSPVPRKKISTIIENILKDNKVSEAVVGIILLNNKKIKKINKEFLSHDYITDVISFRLEDEPLEGEVYISVEKAEEQAKDYGVSLMNEILRLVAHGVLHLVGYDDDTPEKRNEMHQLENLYIASLAKR
jgi:rRNA maturation RNase YbeY